MYYGTDMIQALGNSLKYINHDGNDSSIQNTINFINSLKDVISKKLQFDYGLIKTSAGFKLSCLTPRICFDSLKETSYNKILFTSGTLPPKGLMEFLTGLKFQKSYSFKLP